MHSTERRFAMVPPTVLQACMCALFSPEIVQAGAVKGLNKVILLRWSWFIVIFRPQRAHAVSAVCGMIAKWSNVTLAPNLRRCCMLRSADVQMIRTLHHFAINILCFTMWNRMRLRALVHNQNNKGIIQRSKKRHTSTTTKTPVAYGNSHLPRE